MENPIKMDDFGVSPYFWVDTQIVSTWLNTSKRKEPFRILTLPQGYSDHNYEAPEWHSYIQDHQAWPGVFLAMGFWCEEKVAIPKRVLTTGKIAKMLEWV